MGNVRRGGGADGYHVRVELNTLMDTDDYNLAALGRRWSRRSTGSAGHPGRSIADRTTASGDWFASIG